MKTILLATDGSPSSEKAATEAIELARTTGRHLHVVTVQPFPHIPFGYGPMTVVPYECGFDQQHARGVVNDAVQEARDAGLEPTCGLQRGVPAEEICHAADEIDADLIVVGAHGWGPMKRLVLGSVSAGVMHHAKCPVLVVRADATRARPERELATMVSG